MNRRLVGSQNGLGYIGEDKNLIPMQQLNHESSVAQPITKPQY